MPEERSRPSQNGTDGDYGMPEVYLTGAALGWALIAAGIPVVVCSPCPGYGRPGMCARRGHESGKAELHQPAGWGLLTAEECDLSGYREGVDTLAMVGGHGIDLVDVDTKDGGSLDYLPEYQRFGRVRTPSDGVHDYVRSTGYGKVSPFGTLLGHVGDYVGGTAEGGSRLLAYLPGSTRPKYPGKSYEVVEPIEIAACLAADPDPALCDALDDAGASQSGAPGARATGYTETGQWLAEHSTIPDSLCPYGRNVLDALLRESRDEVVPGDPVKGRHGWAVRSAVRGVELTNAGCWSAADLDALGDRLAEIKPEEDWLEAVGWGISNAKGSVECSIHRSPADDFLGLADEPETPPGSSRFAFKPGGSFLLDTDPEPVPLWGCGHEVVQAEGESLIIAGPQGTGKTTLAQQHALARCGLRSELLGYPVQPGRRRTLYLAMDRPMQAARSMRRMVTDDDRAVLDDRLIVWKGPPPRDLAKHPELLTEMCQEADADTVVVDSLKDAFIGLTDDEAAAGWNRARQTALTAGVEMVELHHQRKQGKDQRGTSATIDDIYGSTWITSGAGSVVLLAGAPGDPIVRLLHVKQPDEPVGPLQVIHDNRTGTSEVYHAADLVALARANGDGITAVDAARALFESTKPTTNEKEKARRRLEKLERSGHLTIVQKGEASSQTPTRWGLVDDFGDQHA